MVDGGVERTVAGTPQGGVVSPLLSNIFLHVLDTEVTRRGVGADFGRDVDFITDPQAAAIHFAWPRHAMATSLADLIVSQAQARPEKAPRYSIAGELLRERTTGGVTTLETGAAASRWGS